MIISEEAKAKILSIINEDPELDGMSVRVAIVGGGCSGFQYNFTFDTEKEDDWHEDNVLIDPMSFMYLNDATLDYTEDALKGSAFVVKNPNAKTTCGCGSSFSAG
jgi:iron-sulfur cluster insertion protein